MSVAKAPWFKKSLAMDDFVVSDPFFGPITGRWVTVLTYPVHDDQGKKIGFLGLPLDLALYVPNLSSVPLISGTTLGIVTTEGVFVWRNLDTEKWVGEKYSNNKTLQNLLAGKVGEMEGIDAVARLYHVDRVAATGWITYAGIPSSYVNAQLYDTLFRNLVLGLICLIFILGLAWLIARQISRPIGALALASRAIRTGNQHVRAEMNGPPEIIEVAREFNEMLKVRWKTEAALRESEAKLSDALKIARLGHWEYELAKDEFIFNDQYYSLHETNEG
ncbi:MAG: HAMP domain-containing protein [Gallionellaceae bacterium]|nr:HAMP domain-containing protein [Gallionellaceae bacterium]